VPQLLDRSCDWEVRATYRIRHHEARSQFALKIFAVCTTAQGCSVTCLHRRLDAIIRKGVPSADGGAQTVRTSLNGISNSGVAPDTEACQLDYDTSAPFSTMRLSIVEKSSGRDGIQWVLECLVSPIRASDGYR
jgi:hypothetical protein